MEAWQWSILLHPFVLVGAFFVLIVPIEMLLAKFWPEGRLRNVLFDKTFQKRHPWYFMAVWTVLVVGLWATIAVTFWREGFIG